MRITAHLFFGCLTVAALTTSGVRAQGRLSQPELSLDPETTAPWFTHLTVEDGLPENSGTAFLQDTRGFLWIATINGLVRYDGYTFEIFRNDPDQAGTLGGNSIVSLLEDTDGNLWAGILDGGLSRFDRATETFETLVHDPDDPNSLLGSSVFALLEDRRGNLWIGSGTDDSEGGLQRYDRTTGTFTNFQHDPDDPASLSDNRVAALLEDRDGMLWVGTYGGGLDRFDPETGTFTHYRHDPDDPATLSDDRVLALLQDRHGTLWVGVGEYWGQDPDGGLNRFDPETGAVTRFIQNPDDPTSLCGSTVHSIIEDQQGALWAGTIDGGLNRFDPKTETFTCLARRPGDPHSLIGENVLSVYQDRSGVLWAGTWGTGISRLDDASTRFGHFAHENDDANGLPGGDVMSLLEDSEGFLWIVTFGGGLARYDRATETFRRFRHEPGRAGSLAQDIVRYVYEDRQGTLWVGLWGEGLERFDRRTRTFTHFRPDSTDAARLRHGHVRALYEDHQGRFWVGTWGGGLHLMDRATGVFTNYRHIPGDSTSLGNDQIASLYEDGAGRFWVGTNGDGIFLMDRDAGTFRRIGRDDEIKSSRVLEDRAGRFWLMGFDGLIQYDPETEDFTRFTEKDGLLSEVITNILEDRQGFLWLSSRRGLDRFDPETHAVRHFTRADGLRMHQFNPLAAVVTREGELFFGGENGVHHFFPDRLAGNTTPPAVALTELRIDNRPVPIDANGPLKQSLQTTTNLTLAHDQKDLGFTFAALHFQNPAQNRYRYRLEGYDDAWVEAGAVRTAKYTNLPPGDYIFRVAASNSDGVWNEEGASLRLTILPPWWRTWWAYGLYGLLFIGGVVSVDRIQRRRLMRKARARARIERAEMQARAAEAESRALKAENEQKKNVELLSRIGRDITATLSVEQIIGTVYENVNALMDATVFGIGIFDAEKDGLVFPATKEKGETLPVYTIPIDADRPAVWCFKNGQEIFTNHYSAESHRFVKRRQAPVAGVHTESVLYLPLIHQRRVIGVITAQSLSREAYTSHEVNILRTLATYAAIALDNAEAYRTLGDTVEELKITQAQLVQQEKLASLGQLTAGIAHEIKNPLNFINNFAEVIEELADEVREVFDEGAADEARAILDDLKANAAQISKHGRRADGIVRAMMQHARGSSGELETTDLNALVEEYAGLAYHGKRARTPDLNVELVTNLDADVGAVEVAPQEIGRVLLNLLGNAFDALIEHTSQNGRHAPEVRVSTRRLGDYVEIRVADNGPGIAPEVRDRIFEPFFTTKPTGSGTGLGLSLSHDIVTQGHGGTLTVESAPGRGATFVVTLPVAPVVPPPHD